MYRIQVYRHSRFVSIAGAGSVVVIGNFDGVHKGHQHLFERAHHHAKMLRVPIIALTFEPHPKKVLRPDSAPKRLTGFAEKTRRLDACGIDGVYALRFTKDYAQTTPEEFIKNTLVKVLRVRKVVIGEDFAFGKDRSAGIELLKTLGPQYGYSVDVVAPFAMDGEVCSSTLIRDTIAAGNLNRAEELLGWPIKSQVVDKIAPKKAPKKAKSKPRSKSAPKSKAKSA